jgi:hypothetical protein
MRITTVPIAGQKGQLFLRLGGAEDADKEEGRYAED